MRSNQQSLPPSSLWIEDFKQHLQRRKHIILHGNVHDVFLDRGSYTTLPNCLLNHLLHEGFEIIIRYDQADGFVFADESAPFDVYRHSSPSQPGEMRQLFEAVLFEGIPTPNAATNSHRTRNVSPPSMSSSRATQDFTPEQIPPQGIPEIESTPQSGDIRSPESAFAELRLLLRQDRVSVAAIVDLADMLTCDPHHYEPPERNALVLLKKCALEAAYLTDGPARGYCNALIIIAGDLKRFPDWFYIDNPFISLIQVTRPSRDERRQFAHYFIRPSRESQGFFEGDKLSFEELEIVADELADLTEGLHAIDLDALLLTSHTERFRLRPNEVYKLVDYFKFGVRKDPWEDPNFQKKLSSAASDLSQRVIGQRSAVDAVVSMLASARIGLTVRGGTRSTRPKGIFFFVGPTGVGKTELAKAVAQLVFGDERALTRFDMSEYKEEHAAEKLVGAPPGFVGYEQGGQLTSRVLQNPHSILLFDEIEKAHPRVLDKFLQILDDGRLTDGKGQTAYFSQTAIIFTSNIGSVDYIHPETGEIRKGLLTKIANGELTTEAYYKDIERHFKDEVKWYFTVRLQRLELLNRLGDNIVVFDILRSECISLIVQKFLRYFQKAALDKYGLSLSFNQSVNAVVLERMLRTEELLMGGRNIGSTLEKLVERPFNFWLLPRLSDLDDLAGTQLEVGLLESGDLEVKPQGARNLVV